ncbi:hypothetical protein L9F63_005905, partial [Diploptera punctata]
FNREIWCRLLEKISAQIGLLCQIKPNESIKLIQFAEIFVKLPYAHACLFLMDFS